MGLFAQQTPRNRLHHLGLTQKDRISVAFCPHYTPKLRARIYFAEFAAQNQALQKLATRISGRFPHRGSAGPIWRLPRIWVILSAAAPPEGGRSLFSRARGEACRRQQDETDAALAETADAILRGE